MKARDAASYQIAALSEKVQLVGLLDEHPLQTKKRRDYAVWREAIMAEAGGEPTRDLSRFIQPLRYARAYRPAEPGPALEMLDNEFGSWCSGFVDGEGSFSIHHRSSDRVETKFRLGIRDDDQAVLETIRERLGVGAVCHNSKALARSRGVKARDAADYQVGALSEKVQLVELFDRYPLRSKKARDYAIWRSAVLAQANGESTHDLVRYIAEIKAARAYRGPQAILKTDAPLGVS